MRNSYPRTRSRTGPVLSADRAEPKARTRRDLGDQRELSISEPCRIRNKAHLRYVASRPAWSAAGVRLMLTNFGLPGHGNGRKVSDEFTKSLQSASPRQPQYT